MHPQLREKYLQWKFLMDNEGIPFVLTCVLRTQSEQEALYAQGRAPLDEVNKLRTQCGMSKITEQDNKRKVTWTRNSKHFAKADGFSRAFDFALLKPDKKTITWDIKWDGDADSIADYLEAAKFAQQVGLDSGAFWSKSKDYPHVQLLV